MMYTYKHDTVTWIDLEHPTREEVRDLIERYEIDPLVAEELLNKTHRPRVELHKNYIYLILHFPTHFSPKQMDAKHHIEEVDFIIGKNFLITARYGQIEAMHQFSKMFETDSILHKQHLTQHAGFVFYHMIRSIYKSLYTKIEDIKTTLAVFEDEIFEGHEKEMVFELSKMNRVTLYFREALILHKDILTSFESAGKMLFDTEFSHYLSAVISEYGKVESALASTKDYLQELRQTNDSLLSTKQNEIMKMLTIVSFITFPLTLVSSIFGMNTSFIPLTGSEHDFWIVLLIMITLATAMFTLFKHKKWI